MNQRIHFIGIGGTGMGPLAKIFLEMGWQVSGSDLKLSETTQYLERLGARISLGHKAEYVDGAEHVVYSSAIPKDNPEYATALERNLHLYHRSELVAKLLNEGRGVAVGGAHGKSTTTSMIAWVLEQAGLDPTVLIGAHFEPFGPGAKHGSGEVVVAEADESDRSFLRYHPEIAVVTCIEPDHLENYNGSFSELIDTYKQFLANVKPGGVQVLGIDDQQVREIVPCFPRAVTYGFSTDAQWRAELLSIKPRQTRFVLYRGGTAYGEFSLKVPGRLYVSNACAAIVVCDLLGVDSETIRKYLAQFTGAQRRFQIICETEQDITVVDDYAHHPTEIAATLKAAREGWNKRVIAVFQPHRYSRTKFLMEEFAHAFADADIIVLTDIYAPPPEQPIPGVSAGLLAEKMRELGKEVYFVPDQADIPQFLLDLVRSGDLVITMGAGPIWKSAQELCRFMA
mgnify:CR=1 FL=1